MPGKFDFLSTETIEEHFAWLQAQYEKFMAENKGISIQDVFKEQLKVFHSDLEAFQKLNLRLKSAAEELKPKLQAEMLERLLMLTLKCEQIAASYDAHEDAVKDRASRLAELLYACLDQDFQNTTNPITFLSKMRVFPRVTLLGKVDNSQRDPALKLLLQKERVLVNLGNIYLRNIAALQSQQGVQAVELNIMRQRAITVFTALKDINLPERTRAQQKAQENIDNLTVTMEQDTKKRKGIKPNPSPSTT